MFQRFDSYLINCPFSSDFPLRLLPMFHFYSFMSSLMYIPYVICFFLFLSYFLSYIMSYISPLFVILAFVNIILFFSFALKEFTLHLVFLLLLHSVSPSPVRLLCLFIISCFLLFLICCNSSFFHLCHLFILFLMFFSHNYFFLP